MGTALAIDGFVIEIVKLDAKVLNGNAVATYRNVKGFWGLISQRLDAIQMLKISYLGQMRDHSLVS